MTIIQLEYLIAVANCGSFSLASEQCFVTQPSLSMQIKNLEEELGVVLLDRTKKPVVPTEVGALFIQNAKETLKAYNFIKESVSEFKGEVAGSMRLGVIPTIAPYLLHRFVPDFVKRYPKVQLEIKEMVTTDIITAMNKDRIDAAIMASIGTPRGIIEEELFTDRFFAYVSPYNNLYERPNIRIEDISIKELLLLSEGHCLRDQILELCQASRKSINSYSFECGSLETIMRIVDATSKMTIIPEMATAFVPENRKSQIKMLAKGATSRKITLATRRTYVKRSLVSALKQAILSVVPSSMQL